MTDRGPLEHCVGDLSGERVAHGTGGLDSGRGRDGKEHDRHTPDLNGGHDSPRSRTSSLSRQHLGRPESCRQWSATVVELPRPLVGIR